MTRLKILKVENVEGDFTQLEKENGSTPEISAYGLFSLITAEHPLQGFAKLRQESLLYHFAKDLATYVINNHFDEDISVVLNNYNKDFLGDKRFISADEKSFFTAYIKEVNGPQYQEMRKIAENLKQE